MSSKANKARCAAWQAEQVAKADKFTIVMFLGHPAGYDVRESASLDDARARRADMLAEYAGTNYGRTAVIYAVTPDNVTVLVE